jgi:tetratricopeptide (TPR) repeat protein
MCSMPPVLARSLRRSALLLGACAGIGGAQQRPVADSTLAAADAAWDVRDLPKARALYQRIVDADSTATSRAAYRLATLLSWEGQFPEAIRLYELYVRLEPRDLDGRVGLARVYAWSSRFAAAVATYDTVLTRNAEYRDAALGRARALGAWGRLPDALVAYRDWRARHPDDVEAALAIARVLAWKGSLAESEALYDSLRTTGGVDAEKGAALVQAWRGDLAGSEVAWEKLTVRFPKDPEVWVGLAQVQRWMGRPFDARVALDEALRVHPGYDDAQQQMRWVRAEIAPQFSTTLMRADDSDGNLLESMRLGLAGARAWGGRWALVAEQRRVGQGAVAQSTALRGSLLWQPPHRHVSWRGDLGVARLDAGVATVPLRDVLTGILQVTRVMNDRLTVGLAAARAPLDEVRSTLSRGLMFGTLAADASVRATSQLTIAVAAGAGQARGDLEGGRSRTTALARAQWTVHRSFAFSATARTTAWNRPAYGVFYAPQRQSLAEVGTVWERPHDLGVVLRADAALALQRVRFEHDAAKRRTVPRATLVTGWRFAPGREILATFVYANVASTATLHEGDYRYSALSLGGRYSY